MRHLSERLEGLGIRALSDCSQVWMRNDEIVCACVGDLFLISSHASRTWGEIRKVLATNEPCELKQILGVGVAFREVGIELEMRDFFLECLER